MESNGPSQNMRSDLSTSAVRGEILVPCVRRKYMRGEESSIPPLRLDDEFQVGSNCSIAHKPTIPAVRLLFPGVRQCIRTLPAIDCVLGLAPTHPLATAKSVSLADGGRLRLDPDVLR